MQAVPPGPEHRAQRETASTLFLLMAEEEQAEKARKVKEMQKHKQQQSDIEMDPVELAWARGIVTQLNDALKAEDFKRPHHQLWKQIGPGLSRKDGDELFGDIRNLIWDKWNPIAWQHGFRTSWDTSARRNMCSRIVNVANAGKAPEVKKLLKEIEERTCLEWPEIADHVDRPQYDETWSWTKRDDGTWGTPNAPTSM